MMVPERVHPACDLFPMLSDSELDELAADIKANGLRDPVVLWVDPAGSDTAILDGRNRLEACRRAGVEPRTTQYTGDDPVSFALSRNLRRRHLDESQRSMVGAKVVELYEEEAKKREESGRGEDGSGGRGRKTLSPTGDRVSRERKSVEKAAKATGSSGRSIQRAKKVLDAGAPEVVAAVQSGAVTVSDAAKVVKLSSGATRDAMWSVRSLIAVHPFRSPVKPFVAFA